MPGRSMNGFRVKGDSDGVKQTALTDKRNSAVLVSEEDWSAIQETLYLLSVPGMRESIREGMEAPVDECDEELIPQWIKLIPMR